MVHRPKVIYRFSVNVILDVVGPMRFCDGSLALNVMLHLPKDLTVIDTSCPFAPYPIPDDGWIVHDHEVRGPSGVPLVWYPERVVVLPDLSVVDPTEIPSPTFS